MNVFIQFHGYICIVMSRHVCACILYIVLMGVYRHVCSCVHLYVHMNTELYGSAVYLQSKTSDYSRTWNKHFINMKCNELQLSCYFVFCT